MRAFLSVFRVCGMLVAASFLVACGGGGGSSEPPPFTVSFDKSSVAFTALQGSSSFANAATINAVGTGTAPDALYVGAVVSGAGIITPIPVTINQSAHTAVISIMPNTSMAPGTYTGTITLYACKDQSCISNSAANFRGSPFAVSYSVVISPRLAISSAQSSATTPESTIATPIPLSVTLPTGVSSANVTVTYAKGQGWLQVNNQGSTLTLTPDARSLKAGTYSAAVVLQTSNPAMSVNTNVTFVVTPGLSAPANQSMTLDGHSIAGSTIGSFAIAGATGVTVPAWSISTDATWLVFDQATGAGAGNANWHIDLSALSALENFASQVAHVSVNAGANLTPVTATLTLTKQLPEISSIDRVALSPSTAGNVMIYGAGFNSINNVNSDLRISGVTPTSLSVLSDKAIQVIAPALATGDYTVSLANSLNIPTRTKVLSVLAPIDRSVQVLATQGAKQGLIWDPISQSAFSINKDLNSVMRFDLSGTAVALSARNIAGINNIGLNRDLNALLAIDNSGQLFDLSTANLSILKTRSVGVVPASFLDSPIPITGDNIAWLAATNAFAYDLDKSKAVTVLDANGGYFFYNGPWAVVSPNGQRMLMTQSSSVSPNPPMLYWDAVEGKLKTFSSNAPIKFFYRTASQRDGQRWILDNFQMYGFDLGPLGQMHTPTDWVSIRVQMAGNGKRAYVYALNGNAIGTYSEPSPVTVWPRIYVFDTSATLVSATDFPLLGYFDLTDYVACRATQGPAACSPYSINFTITDDNKTLLAIGDRNFMVIPIPPSYQSPP